MTNVQLVQRWLLVERVLMVIALVTMVLSFASGSYGAWSLQPTLVLVGVVGVIVSAAIAECSTKAMLKALEYECASERSTETPKLPQYASDVELAAWDERIKTLVAKRAGK